MVIKHIFCIGFFITVLKEKKEKKNNTEQSLNLSFCTPASKQHWLSPTRPKQWVWSGQAQHPCIPHVTFDKICKFWGK